MRLSPLIKWAVSLGTLSGAALMFGFFVFCATLPRADQALELTQAGADNRAIIVLTGGGGPRIEHGLALQNQGLADRVLITGVNPSTTKADLESIGDAETLDCCVDLGPWARSTRGNAAESRAWLDSHGYETALLVTSDFHLPRAMLELRHAAPDVELIGVPVASDFAPEKGWMSKPSSWALLAGEYVKYLYVRTITLI